VYSQFIQSRVGNKTFTHIEYPSISSYMLINNNVEDIDIKEMQIKKMFERTYQTIPDIVD